jgi:hypothetical protein
MSRNAAESPADRRAEWFVPRFGPPKFRSFVGLLFLPYTGMVLSFSVIGSMLGEPLHWERVPATVVIYFLGLGIAAHALDALGSKNGKPWGNTFTRGQLWLLASLSLTLAYALAIYYMVKYVPLLWFLAVSEGFFAFAYNLEWFKGKFHTDAWFAFSWGFLPVLAGYIMQTNRISAAALAVALSMALFSLVEIKASRPYKEFKQRLVCLREEEKILMVRYESILKSISLGVILLGAGLLVWRVAN